MFKKQACAISSIFGVVSVCGRFALTVKKRTFPGTAYQKKKKKKGNCTQKKGTSGQRDRG